MPANERLHTTSPVNQRPSTSKSSRSAQEKRRQREAAAKAAPKVQLDEDEYVQITPASPGTRERQLKAIEAEKADRALNGPRRHRGEVLGEVFEYGNH